MIIMKTENGTTKIYPEGDNATLAADSALIVLNGFRMYAEYTATDFNNEREAALYLMSRLLTQLSQE